MRPLAESLAEDIWAMLQEVCRVADDRLLYADFVDGCRHGCVNEVDGEWRGLHFSARLAIDWDHLSFIVAGGRERRARFAELEAEVVRRLKRMVTLDLRASIAPYPRQRLSPLAW